jgi:hypothetical protein
LISTKLSIGFKVLEYRRFKEPLPFRWRMMKRWDETPFKRFVRCFLSSNNEKGKAHRPILFAGATELAVMESSESPLREKTLMLSGEHAQVVAAPPATHLMNIAL